MKVQTAPPTYQGKSLNQEIGTEKSINDQNNSINLNDTGTV